MEPQPPYLVRWFNLLVRLFPTDYQRNYGDLTMQLFADIYRDAALGPPGRALPTLTRAIVDTIIGIGQQHYLSKQTRLMKKTAKPNFYSRHRTALLSTSAAIIILSLASVLTGFWTYRGPAGYIQRIIAGGLEIEKYAGSNNAGEDDITAFFVNDYIQAHYYGDKRTDVGTSSPHAFRLTYTDHGQTFTQSLAENLNTAYATKQADFDDITCSTQAPVAVKYIHRGSSGLGQATTIAAFYYPNQTEPNLVEYYLRLDPTNSPQGDWKVANITCLSRSLQSNRPYTTALEALQTENYAKLPASTKQQIGPQPTPYDQRNDRTFGPKPIN